MSEETVLDVESHERPEDVAATLRSIADDLESGDDLSIDVHGESVTLTAPGDTLEFEVEVEREPSDAGEELELELELEWTTHAGGESQADTESAATSDTAAEEGDGSVPQDDLSIE